MIILPLFLLVASVPITILVVACRMSRGLYDSLNQ